MQEFDRVKSQLKQSKESKQKGKKDILLKKRKRDDAGLPTGMPSSDVVDSSLKRQKIEDKSETYKSLFIKTTTREKEMLAEGKYEGDFMTRCAKWGLQ